jgi:hypothetical protein
MVGVEPECALWFQGTAAPAALGEYPFTAARSRTPTMHCTAPRPCELWTPC